MMLKILPGMWDYSLKICDLIFTQAIWLLGLHANMKLSLVHYKKEIKHNTNQEWAVVWWYLIICGQPTQQ